MTQGETLVEMPNSFKLKNRVHCFNHTLQLSVKTLLHPFNAGLGKATEDGTCDNVDDLLSLGIDKLDALDADSHEVMMNDTAAVCEMVTKVWFILSTCNVSLIHI
jgi:hypothetical protein